MRRELLAPAEAVGIGFVASVISKWANGVLAEN
jgi:hypothetical protein